MQRENRTALLFMLVSVGLFASFLFYLPSDVFFSGREFRQTSTLLRNHHNLHLHLAIATEDIRRTLHHLSLLSSSVADPHTVSILLPDWEVLFIVSPDNIISPDVVGDPPYCLFQNNATSPAKPAGTLPSTNLTTFKCLLPRSVRSIRPIIQPILTKRRKYWPGTEPESPQLFRWDFLAYDSYSTKDDVVLFVKGVNNRQGVNRSPTDLRCVFGDGVLTDVTSSSMEVFRCRHPDETALSRLSGGENEKKIKISLKFQFQGQEEKNKVVPSVAYYTPRPKSVAAAEAIPQKRKSRLCACTMVYNVAKFLKEWVHYHSKLGVEKFFLYDNGSDDGLEHVVSEILRASYDKITIETLLWPWPKTQEAGFSHCALHARDSCTWMMYIDVDEFVFSPSWLRASHPSTKMLRSMLPSSSWSISSQRPVGQIGIRCLEFGPSKQRSNPVQGVTQGYTCRRRVDQRHKSMVLLDAVDESLENVIHHFRLKEGYRMKWLSMGGGVVNHYKYQAWPEFKNKFRRRVSAYVADWREETNPNSNDRTPGLGFLPVKPKGWANKFCEVNDTRLRQATKRWFGSQSRTGFKMAWQDM